MKVVGLRYYLVNKETQYRHGGEEFWYDDDLEGLVACADHSGYNVEVGGKVYSL